MFIKKIPFIFYVSVFSSFFLVNAVAFNEQFGSNPNHGLQWVIEEDQIRYLQSSAFFNDVMERDFEYPSENPHAPSIYWGLSQDILREMKEKDFDEFRHSDWRCFPSTKQPTPNWPDWPAEQRDMAAIENSVDSSSYYNIDNIEEAFSSGKPVSTAPAPLIPTLMTGEDIEEAFSSGKPVSTAPAPLIPTLMIDEDISRYDTAPTPSTLMTDEDIYRYNIAPTPPTLMNDDSHPVIKIGDPYPCIYYIQEYR